MMKHGADESLVYSVVLTCDIPQFGELIAFFATDLNLQSVAFCNKVKVF